MTKDANPELCNSLPKRRRQAGGPIKWSTLKTVSALLVLGAATAIASPAQTVTDLLSFDGTNGGLPYAGLVQGTDGNFYGTTYNGGSYGDGTVFKITAAGKLTTLYSFCPGEICTDGMHPNAGLVQASNGNFYGTTLYGGPNGDGNIFEITPAGKLTSIYLFCPQVSICPDGSAPYAGLVQASNGRLYGATTAGGIGSCAQEGCGTIFEITLSGALTTLYSFCSAVNSQGYCADGSTPLAGPVQTANGNFYGTTEVGGAYNQGTFFEMTPSGRLTTLYSFCAQVDRLGYCTDGSYPLAATVQTGNGNLYGTTFFGGPSNFGTVYEMTPAGKLTMLHGFCPKPGCADGAEPRSSLIQATDGNLYGTTSAGGGSGAGTLFEMSPSGKLATIYTFSDSDGNIPNAGLVQGTSGTFYGTTVYGGSDEDGTVFALSVGLGPFVETRPTSGVVGAEIFILGNGLRGTTDVSFNGTTASFTVVSATEIETTVPAGATSARVQVTTTKGTLTSNMPFRVEP
jgi:uncharacterized repeat protein (TIGR03803 family)